MNSSAIALREPPRGRPFGGGGVHRNGGFGALAPINLFTGIQITHTDQRRAIRIIFFSKTAMNIWTPFGYLIILFRVKS
jgi:hypothetical protein